MNTPNDDADREREARDRMCECGHCSAEHDWWGAGDCCEEGCACEQFKERAD